MRHRVFWGVVGLAWVMAPLDGVIGAPSDRDRMSPPFEDDASVWSEHDGARPPHPVGVEDAWLRVLGPEEGTPQPVFFHHAGRRVHAFDLPSARNARPQVRVEDVGDVRVVWAYLREETRLGVSLRDGATGEALDASLLVEGETFVEELGCGGILHVNDLVVILDGSNPVTVGMRFANPTPDETDLVSVLVYPRPGLRGRLRHLRRPSDPRSRLYGLDAGRVATTAER